MENKYNRRDTKSFLIIFFVMFTIILFTDRNNLLNGIDVNSNDANNDKDSNSNTEVTE